MRFAGYRRFPGLVPCLLLLALAGCASDKAAEDTSSIAAQSHYFRGNEMMKRRDYAGAAGEFEQAVAIAPREILYLNDLGLAYLDGGRSKEAVPVYERSCRLIEAAYGGQSTRLYACDTLWGRALEDSGDVEAAVSRYQAAYAIVMAVQPQDSGNRMLVLSWWQKALARLGREREILPYFETLLADTPSDAKVRPYIEESLRRLKLRLGPDGLG